MAGCDCGCLAGAGGVNKLASERRQSGLSLAGTSEVKTFRHQEASKWRRYCGCLAGAGAVSKLATGPIEAVRVQTMTTGQPLLTVVRQTFARGGFAAFFAGVEAGARPAFPSALQQQSFEKV